MNRDASSGVLDAHPGMSHTARGRKEDERNDRYELAGMGRFGI